jgi:hypothetical protein
LRENNQKGKQETTKKEGERQENKKLKEGIKARKERKLEIFGQ